MNAPMEPEALKKAIAAHRPGGGTGGDSSVDAVVRHSKGASLHSDGDGDREVDDPMGGSQIQRKRIRTS